MANPEHVALVQQGARVIAAWRETHPGTRLDLEQANLEGMHLRGVNLQGANLQQARLQEADLEGANLQQASLRAAYLVGASLQHARLQQARLVRANLEQARLQWARLHKAHLHGAYLQEAHLQEANLQGAYLLWTYLVGAHLDGARLEQADLQWANLQHANLAGAQLQEANLHEVVLGYTTFDNTNLNGTWGLDTCRHQDTSSLDLATLAQSGVLPESFLRGCGWSEALIGSIAGLLQEQPWQPVIERSVAFPPACYQAGLAMLTYCGTLLHQQHPDIPTTIRIEQAGLIVRLLVEAPAAQRDTVEQTLQAYGLVVAGQQTPDALLVDPLQTQRLQQKLASIETEWRRMHDGFSPPAPPGAPEILPVAEVLPQLRQLVGNALCDL
jgi:uncharacterized protein YjbI with pentapeptide repeats